ncbi:hypothetical protein EK21DRAFT_111578 [Setomelanomma holmii]|uniref:Uncharacterized protein n=1 Tax=Setomelanomma holmii TaxID=210430 RepID=A0A9P4HAX0_9PLEO|nr:hypothetical protein EK21DRAFT_111578 [Setomelanomma holmii]
MVIGGDKPTLTFEAALAKGQKILSYLDSKDVQFTGRLESISTLSYKDAHVSPDTLPAVQHWSDIAYLQCKTIDHLGIQDEPLLYVLRYNIQNRGTVDVMSNVLGVCAELRLVTRGGGTGRPYWPGLTFPMCSETAQALFGTPNGSGIGWLSAQHKSESELGQKVIDEVTLFFVHEQDDYALTPGRFWEHPCLLVHVKDVEASEVEQLAPELAIINR